MAGQRTGPTGFASTGNSSGHGQGNVGTCSQMRHGMLCATSTHLEAARAANPGLPIAALAGERQRRVVRWGRRRIFSRARQQMPMRREGIDTYTVETACRHQAALLSADCSAHCSGHRHSQTPAIRSRRLQLLDPAEFLRASGLGRSTTATHAARARRSSRRVKQHHTTPHQYEERGRGGTRRSR